MLLGTTTLPHTDLVYLTNGRGMITDIDSFRPDRTIQGSSVSLLNIECFFSEANNLSPLRALNNTLYRQVSYIVYKQYFGV
jgi:hypothetical protein